MGFRGLGLSPTSSLKSQAGMGTQIRPKGLQQHRFVHLAVSSLTEQRTEDNSGSKTRAKTNDKDKTRENDF